MVYFVPKANNTDLVNRTFDSAVGCGKAPSPPRRAAASGLLQRPSIANCTFDDCELLCITIDLSLNTVWQYKHRVSVTEIHVCDHG